MRWMDWRGRESVGVLRWGFLNAYFQTGVRNLMDAAILQEGELGQGRHCNMAVGHSTLANRVAAHLQPAFAVCACCNSGWVAVQ